MNRLFLALKAQLNDYTRLQNDFLASVKGQWVSDENLHLTLCYFGDRYEIKKLKSLLPSAIKEIAPLTLNSLGFFEHNNILYAKTKSKELEELESSICDTIEIENKKIFIPHVTLMRIKEIKNKKAFKHKLHEYKDVELGSLDTRVVLINSHLNHDGAKYEILKRY